MFTLYSWRSLAAFAAVCCLAGCEAAKSSNPTAASVAGPIPGVNITAPRPLEPFAGQRITFTGQPQTLLIENAGTSGTRSIWLEIDIATDAAFTQLVHHANNVPLGDNGRTSYQLPVALPAGYTYYWRVKANDGANSGPYAEASNFSVVPPVVIEAPRSTTPSGTINTNNPEFRVTNGAISGTSGVAYQFEVSRNSTFTQLIALVTVPVNGSGSTTMTLGSLPYAEVFYWRARGSDGSTESSYSNVLAFRTPEAPKPAPGTGPDTGLAGDSASWTTEQWRQYVFALIAQKGGGAVSLDGLRAMRGDVVARGADFQNGWRGDMRPRIFLPVPGCPPASSPGVPDCSYNRTVDLGDWGGAWQWVPRF
jgi:hypothetical protein